MFKISNFGFSFIETPKNNIQSTNTLYKILQNKKSF